jgi:NADPH:quinone reductase-like Zn-dependent oxidoreductase
LETGIAMKQIVTTANGGYEVLKVQEIADLHPKADQLLIEVKAAGLNFADILARKGQYPDAPSKPCILGYEVSGVVTSVGSSIDQRWIGKDVIALCRFKGQAEQVCVGEDQVFEKPDTLSYREAAAIPVNYLTAWILLKVMGSLQENESILIHNAGGGVGIAALDIAKHIGAKTYGTASAHKHTFLRKRGLDYPIDYRNTDWLQKLMELTEDRGVDLITDPLGGKEWKRSYKALRSTGRLGMFGISSASSGSKAGLKSYWSMLKTVIQMPLFHPLSLLNKNHGVFGVNLGHLWHERKRAAGWAQHILDGVEEGWINPHVDATFKFEQVGEAHKYIEERKNIGKVILQP